MDIFGRSIERIAELVDGPSVEVPHNNETVFAKDSQGRTWVRKRASICGHEAILAEALCSILAGEIGAAVPAGAVHDRDGDLSWLSLMVPSSHWDPNRVHFIGNLDRFARVLALDVLVLNQDRHLGNILLQPEPDEYSLMAWGIDFESAAVSHPAYFAERRNEIPGVEKLARGIPNLVGEPALAGAAMLAGLPSSTIRAAVNEACSIAAVSEGTLLLEVLVERAGKLVDLTGRYLKAIESKP